MYRHCVFCTAALGANDAIPEFPVGKHIAFEPWNGRIWAVCPGCRRWNLAPIEERWEAVETAERLFRDTPSRTQSEQIGVARLRDKTLLVRVGRPLPGELAAWRYGDELAGRRRRFIGVTIAMFGFADIGLIAAFSIRHERRERILHVGRAPLAGAGGELQLRAKHLDGARLTTDRAGGGLRIVAPASLLVVPTAGDIWPRSTRGPEVVLEGAAARNLLARAMVQVNAAGASRRRIDDAVTLLARSGSAEGALDTLAGGGRDPDRALGLRMGFSGLVARRGKAPLGVAESIALEMALHEESERRALAGQLAELEAAWREADEIARIADALPGEPAGDERVGEARRAAR